MKTSLLRAIIGCLFALALGASTSLLAQPSPFVGQDVGTPTHPGGFTNNVDGTISINGGGDDIWNAADNCYYYYSSVTGLVWEAKMRVVSFTGPDYWSKIELMARRPNPAGGTPQGPDAELNIEMTQTSQQNEVRPQWRPIGGAASTDNGGTGITPVFPNQWVRMTRVGSTFSVFNGNDGVHWTRLFRTDTATTANGFDGTPWENPILVGAAVTAHNNGDANGATAVISNLTVALVPPPTAAGVVTQIQSTATFQYTEASFTFVATNNATPANVVDMNYAWYKNNQLVSTNPMGTQYTFLTTPADNGAQIYVVATVQAPYDTLSVTSSVATLTVNPPSFIYTNGLKREFFAGGGRQNVEIGNIGRATSISMVSGAQLPGGYGDNYADRFSGYFIPPTTAAYVFFVAADDDTDLYLSPDSNPANKSLIAQELGWSPNLSWLISGSAGVFDNTQKRSDQWSPDPLSLPAANPNGAYLTQGNLYYIEMVHHNGGGGDNFAVTYQTTNQIADPNWPLLFNNGTNSLLQASNNNIALVTSPTTTLSWTLQPTNLTVFEGQAANFFSKAVSDSELAVQYQWYTVAPPAPINGATSPTLSIPVTPANYNGLQGYCVARAAEGGLSITSSVATLTVLQAVWEPGFAKDERWNGVSRPQVENGSAGTPGYVMSVPGFEVGVDNPNNEGNFARRVSGYFVPPSTGNYVFFVNGDDDTDLFISTDNTPGNKRLVCQEVGWSNPWTWVGQGGGGTVSQKRSDQWNNGTGTPWAAGIPLTGGQRYYMEMDFHQGSGGANCEATYKLLADPDPVNGADTRMTGNLIGISAVRCSYVAYTQQPANVTAPPFGHAAFSAVGTTDSQLAIGSIRGNEGGQTNNFIFYQWYKNGVAVAGANGSSYAIDPVLPADNGTTIQCQIRALGYADNSLNRLWSNSVTATVTVSPAAVFEPGWAFVEWWDTSAPSRPTIEAGAAPPPQHLYATPRFEAPVTTGGDNYANRLLGYFVPPTTGDYVFFMNSDDDADLFLSTDSTPANKRLIATEVGWAGNNALGWTQTGGGGDSLAQRRSDQFTDPATGTQPYSSGIHMLAGQKYYMEAVHKEGGGGDYFAATYKLFTDLDPVNGSDSTLVGNAIGMLAPRIPWVAFLQQPSGQSATSGGNSVTFTAKGYSAPSIALGTTGDPRSLFPLPATNVTYQWYKNGTPISGATASSYTLVPILPSDNNAQFVCGIRALGYADNSLNPIFSNSVPAVLNVITDTVPPIIAYAATLQNTNPLTPLFIVDITFSEWMDATTLTNPANYSVAGATITNIVLAPNHRTVELDLNQMPTLPLNVIVNGVKDISGNTIALNSSAPINAVGLTCTDIGFPPGTDPTYPSFITVTASGGYIVAAEGSDIWGNADGFNFTWELKTNDFDVVVRGVNTTHTSQWAKMGLMVRESLDANSRNWNIVNDPASADGIMAPDGTGFGANNVECNMRDTTAAASGGWKNLAGNSVPAYPNAWVRLKRTGNALDAYLGVNGLAWTHVASYNTATNVNGALSNVVYVGLCTTAHNNDPAVGPPPPPFLYYNTVEYANYTSSYIPPAQLTAAISGANIIVSWTPNVGHLEASPAVSGPGVNWVNIGSGNPATIPIGPGARFFRVVNP